MENNDYIIPTKQNPIFTADCDWFGYIGGIYKDYIVAGCSIGQTFGLYYKESVNDLHTWIQDNPDVLKEYPKCKFNLYLIDGSIDKNSGDRIEKTIKKVYSITASKAKKLLL